MVAMDDLDNEVAKVNKNVLKTKAKEIELDENVDFAAAGVKDLNNFKGYHHAKDDE